VLAEEQRLHAVSLVLSRRLRNKLREEMSVTYGAGAAPILLRTPRWYYNVGIQFMASPEDVHRAVDSTWNVIRELKRTGPTSAELAIVAKVQQRRQENARQSNSWWVRELQRYDFMGAPFASLAGPTSTLIGAKEFTAAMDRLLSEESYSQSIVVPTPKTIEKAKEEKTRQAKNTELPRLQNE